MSIRQDIRVLRSLIEDFRPGTIRHWRSGDFVKQVDGTWKPKSSDSRAKQSNFSTSSQTTEDLYKVGGVWSPSRTAVHDSYIAKVNKGIPVSEVPTVYMTGGGPASGKTVGLLNNPLAGIPNSSKAVHADPDGAKEAIPEFVANKNLGDKSIASRVHEESAYMSQEAVKAGLSSNHDVVYDSTGDSGIEKLAAKVKKIREQGAQKVVAHYATVDVDEAIRRSDSRAKHTGRYVPHDYLKQVHRDVTKTVLGAIERGVYDSLDLWDTSSSGAPEHVASYTKSDGLKIHNKSSWEAFQKRGN